MENTVTRRRFLQASTMAAVGLALSACGATPTPTPVPPTPTTKLAAAAPTATTAPAAPAAPTATAAPKATPTVATKPSVELVVSRGEHALQPIYQDAPAHLELTKITGVKLNFQSVPSADWLTKQNLWMSTKQVPDIMRSSFTDMADYANPTVFKPVLPLIEKYGPNLKRFLEAYPNDVKKFKMGGDLFIVPSTSIRTKKLAPMPIFRTDLVEKVGMKLPTTFDELYTVLKEIKKAFPDTIGWTARKPGTQSGIKRELMIVAYPFGSGQGGWAKGIDIPYWEPTVKKWLYGPLYPEYKEVLNYFAKLYKEQLIDPDVANTPTDQFNQKNGSGKGVFVWDNFSLAVGWNKAVRGIDPKATWAPFPIIKGMKGARQADYTGFAGSGGGWTIGAGCKNPERAIELMDYMVTPAGVDLTSWGIEGVHYTLTGTRPASYTDYTQEGLKKAQGMAERKLKPEIYDKYKTKSDPFRTFQGETGVGQLDFSVLWDDQVIYTWDPPGEGDAWYAMSESDPALHPEVFAPVFTTEERTKLKKIQTDVNAIIDPAIDKFVLGQIGMAEWDKAVQDAIKAGAQDWEKIFNEAEARG